VGASHSSGLGDRAHITASRTKSHAINFDSIHWQCWVGAQSKHAANRLSLVLSNCFKSSRFEKIEGFRQKSECWRQWRNWRGGTLVWIFLSSLASQMQKLGPS